nr:hypothetical protein [Tanacetum cinerariifolium]
MKFPRRRATFAIKFHLVDILSYVKVFWTCERGEIKENNKDEENIDMQVDEVKDTERGQTNESETVIKPTWAEEMNNLEAKENVIFENDEEINKDRDQETSNSPSKPLGFEGFRSSTSTFNHEKKRSRDN